MLIYKSYANLQIANLKRRIRNSHYWHEIRILASSLTDLLMFLLRGCDRDEDRGEHREHERLHKPHEYL